MEEMLLAISVQLCQVSTDAPSSLYSKEIQEDTVGLTKRWCKDSH